MKIIVVILSVLVAQASTSFFDEFGGAVFSVKSSVGKLFYDVVIDFTDTVDCTILAVQQVLSDETSSRYNQKCNVGNIPEIVASSYARQNIEVNTPTLAPTLAQVISNIEKFEGERLNQIDSPVSEDQSKPQTDLENVQNLLRRETVHLGDVSISIEKERHDISENADEELKKVELEQQSSLSNESRQINEDIDKILNELITTTVTFNDNTIGTFKRIEHYSTTTEANMIPLLEKRKNEQHTHLDEIKTEKATPIEFDKNTTRVNAFPRTFKDVAQQINTEKSLTTIRLQTNAGSTEANNLLVVLTTRKPHRKKKADQTKAGPKDSDPSLKLSPSEREAIEQARKLIEESKRADMIMNNILKNAKYASNLFDNPDLLAFGK